MVKFCSMMTNKFCFRSGENTKPDFPHRLVRKRVSGKTATRGYFSSPQSKKLIKQKYRYHHPVYGELTVYIGKKRTDERTFQLKVKQKINNKIFWYKQNMLVTDYDQAHNGRSTLKFYGPVFNPGEKPAESIRIPCISDLLHLTASDALQALGTGQLISKEIKINNSLIDINKMQAKRLKRIQAQGWKRADNSIGQFIRHYRLHPPMT